jgi:UDPglucose 6-dehydrogenase
MVGGGYVGLTTAACLADLGNRVVVLDKDETKVRELRSGTIPFFEPGLAEVVERNAKAGRLSFTASYPVALSDAEFVFIAVGTPGSENGEANLDAVEAAAIAIAEHLRGPLIVVNKSTVPIGTGDMVSQIIASRTDRQVSVVSNPEFLREGTALRDFMEPDRIVIGARDMDAAGQVARLYEPLDAQVLTCDLSTAEMVKYASNAFLATRISFINMIARICERVGADVRLVADGMGLDTRIGSAFLDAGIGYGGSCLTGDESVLVRWRGRTELLPLARLYAELADGERCEVRAWRSDAATPEFLPGAAVTRRVVEGEILQVHTKMGRRVRCTADHPFVTSTGVKLAEQLTNSDWIPLAQQSPPPSPISLPPLLDAMAGAGLEPADVIVRPTSGPEPGSAPRPRSVLMVARSHDLARSGAIRQHELRELGMSVKGALLKTARNGTALPDRIAPDRAFWRVVGLYLAEGHVGVDGARRRIQWSFHPTDEQDLVDEVRDFWTDLGVKATVHHVATTTRVVVSSRLLASFWLGALGLGANAYEQRMPDAIWEASREDRLALLGGLWRGDGSWSYVNGGPSVILEYGTVSRPLADGVLRLLGDLGFVGSLRVGRTAKSTQDTYWIQVSGADQIEQLLELVAEGDRESIRRSIADQAKRIAPTGYRRGPAHAAWVRVTSVERQPFSGAVYSLEVPGAHTFVTTGGLVVHNCFPKDVKALAAIADRYGYHPELLHAVMEINREQRLLVVNRLREYLGSLGGRTIGLLGLAFKPNTDDLREAPSVEIARWLLEEGAVVRGYDPVAMDRARELIPGIQLVSDPYAAADGADAVVVVTEWNEFRQLDLARIRKLLRTPILVDGRNIYDPVTMTKLGFRYSGIGRGRPGVPAGDQTAASLPRK